MNQLTSLLWSRDFRSQHRFSKLYRHLSPVFRNWRGRQTLVCIIPLWPQGTGRRHYPIGWTPHSSSTQIQVAVSIAIEPNRVTNSLRSCTLSTILHPSIPRTITRCKVPGASNLAWRAIFLTSFKIRDLYSLVIQPSQQRPLRIKKDSGQ